MRTIPRPSGLAGLRAWLAFIRSPHAMLMTMHRRYGPVFEIALGRVRYVCLLGPEANSYLLIDHAHNVLNGEANQVLTITDGYTAITVSDGADHKRRRRMLSPAFRKQMIDGYLACMVAGIEELLAGLRAGDELDLYPRLARMIADVAIRALFGEAVFARAGELRAHLDVLLGFSNRPFFLQLKIGLPGTAWSRFLAARAAFDAIMYEELERRARAPGGESDVLSLLLAGRDDAGDPIPRVEMRDQIVALLMAGYGTTSSALAWGLAAMIERPGVWAGIRQECGRVLGDRPPTPETLSGLAYTDRVVSEVLRLHDPFFVGARTAIEAFEFAGYRIPAGRMLVFSPYVTHRLPEIWVRPEAFDPDRWRPGSATYRELPSGAYLPFGLGPRRCLGASYAQHFMRTAFAMFAQRTRLELTAPVVPRGHLLVNPRAMHVRVLPRAP